MLKINFSKIFRNDWQTDWELINSQPFINLLGSLGENKWISFINQERHTKYPVNVIIKLRDYFNAPVPVNFSLDPNANLVHELSINTINDKKAYALTVKGVFTIVMQGKYVVDFRPIHLDFQSSMHVIECKQKKSRPDEINFSYAIKVDPTTVRHEDQLEYINLKCESLSIRIDIRIKQITDENQELKNDILILDEIKSMNSDDRVKVWENIKTQVTGRNVAWLQKVGIPSWIRNILAKKISKNQDISGLSHLLILSGLENPELENKTVERNSFNRKNTGQFSETIQQKFINIIRPDMCQFPRLIFNCIAPSTKKNVPIIISDRGLIPIFIPGYILLVRNLFYRREKRTKIRYRDCSGWHTLEYAKKINHKLDLFNNEVQACFDWRENYLTACKLLYFMNYQADFLGKKECKKMQRKTKQAFYYILQRVRGNSVASRNAIRGILMASLNNNRRKSISKITMLSLANYVTPVDWLWARKEKDSWNKCPMRYTKQLFPFTWILRNNILWNKNLDQLIQYYKDNYSGYVVSLARDLELSKDLGTAVSNNIWKMYQIGNLDHDEMSDKDKVNYYGSAMKKIRNMAKPCLIYFWRLHPEETLAKVYFSNLSESVFRPEYFDDYVHMMNLLPIKLWEFSRLAAVMVDYCCQIDFPNQKFISLCKESTKWKEHPIVLLQEKNLSDEKLIKLFNKCSKLSKGNISRFESSILSFNKLSVDMLIAAIRLSKMQCVSLPSTNQYPGEEQIAFRFGYYNRSTDEQIRYIWSNIPHVIFVPEDTSFIWQEDQGIFLSTEKLSITRRNLSDQKVVVICNKTYNDLALSMELLRLCDEITDEEAWCRITPIVLDRILFIYKTDEKQSIPSVDWSRMGSLCLKLLQVYRATSIINPLGYTYHRLADDDINKNKLADIIASVDIKSMIISGSGDDILHHRKIFAIQNKLNQGTFLERDLRGYLNYVIQQDNFHDTLLISMATEYFEKTGLYYPYGDYLVLNWDYVPDVIRNKSHIRQMIFLMTNRLEKKLLYYMYENRSDQNCVIALVRLWEQTGQITPLIEMVINWIIYRINETEVMILQDIISSYIQKRPDKSYFVYLYISICNLQSDKPSLHPTIIKASETKQYLYLYKYIKDKL